jgi:hypothetical protein
LFAADTVELYGISIDFGLDVVERKNTCGTTVNLKLISFPIKSASGEVTWTCCRHLGDVLRTGLILDDGQLEPDHRTAVFAVWRKANPWGGATAGHTQIGLLAHITSGPPGIEQRILANFPFAHGRLAPPAA